MMTASPNGSPPGPTRLSTTTEHDASIGTAVVEAVSSASESAILDMPPLFEVVDPGALDALFSHRETCGIVEFRYAGYVVTVHADRTIELAETT